MEAHPIHILVVDDEESIRWVIEKTLKDSGHHLHFATDAAEGARVLEQTPVDFALVDINLPDDNGLRFLQHQHEQYPNLLMAVITGEATMANAVTAMQLGAFDYLTKPFDIEEMEALVQRAAQAVRAARHHRAAPPPGPRGAEELIIGRSRAIHEIYKAIGRVASTELTVLILGESGTGKELIARSVHQHSPQAEGPFVAVNCAAIPRDLLEAELFGYEKGAFTGAVERKAGRLEAARGGTLLLDEIGDMSLDLQAKLLRVLQEREFQRVGGLETQHLTARIIAATNRSLQERVAAGDFRADLYYRISTVAIEVPPLRERREDIPLLVHHFLRKGAEKLGLAPRSIAPDALQKLMEADWPGNVRELENAVKSLMIMTASNVITLADLPRNIAGGEGAAAAGPAPASLEQSLLRTWGPQIEDYCDNGRTGLLPTVMSEVERPLIRRVLELTRWNQVKTARILGINRNTLRSRMQALDIRREEAPAASRSAEPRRP